VIENDGQNRSKGSDILSVITAMTDKKGERGRDSVRHGDDDGQKNKE
jgi:hypothetical protein